MSTVIRAAGPADFLALVPRLLGFVPSASIVLVPFHGNRTLGVMRLDLPADPDEYDRFASSAVGMVCKVSHADGVAAIVYTDEAIGASALPHSALIDAILMRADLCGLHTNDALCHGGSGWASYLEPDHPAGGHPLAEIPVDDDALATLPAPDGDQASGAELPRADLAETERVGRALARLEHALATMGRPAVPGGGDDLATSLLLDPPTLFEQALRADPDALAPMFAAELVAALARPALRDVALVQWALDHAAGEAALVAQQAWIDRREMPEEAGRTMWGEGPTPDPARLERALALTRRIAAVAPRALRPGALSVCGWLAWALGSSTHAAHYASEARDIDPAHGMAGIVLAYVHSGHLPEWVYQRASPSDAPVAAVIDSRGVTR